MRRRTFIKTAGLSTAVVASGLHAPSLRSAGTAAPSGISILPVGNAPAPLAVPHFPSKFHAFLWRNWPLIPAERLAKVSGASQNQIERTARGMGLGVQPRITREQERLSYITIIKRNWHLLPYDQLLALLDWPAEKLAYTLREDDFLFIKLGSHKPNCEPVHWPGTSPEVLAREQRILEIVRESFPNGLHSREPLFQFVQGLSERRWFSHGRAPGGGLRLCYSYFALYGDPLLEPDLDPYPDGYLARLAGCGVNAVWLQAVLYRLAPFPWQPDLSGRHEERLKNLRRLVARARKCGIAVYLYLNEPRAMPLKFFEAHPQLKGIADGGHATLCTSIPEVQEWMRDSVEFILKSVPDLGGFFTITASENLTNCWSHGVGAKCPRCGSRSGADVIAEVNRMIASGIERASIRRSGSQRIVNTPPLLAWDWGWNDKWAEAIIKQLPENCALMSVSEWSLPIERGGVKSTVGEYSISSIGPGPRATRHWELARKRGLQVVAKIQANNSWELSAVPYIAALENVGRHVSQLRAAGVRDLMLGWTLGGYPSPNLELLSGMNEDGFLAGTARVVGRSQRDDPASGPSWSGALDSLARRYGGEAQGHSWREAWRQFSKAFSEFPFHIGVAYSGPQQLGPANLLFERSTGYRASMVGFPYDDLDGWRAAYPAETFIRQFEKMADGFADGLRTLKQVDDRKLRAEQRTKFASELNVAEAAEIHFRSVANQARFVRARRMLSSAQDAAAATLPLAELEKLLRAEIELARRLHALQCRDSRLGFEATNQYYYVPVDLAEKVINCDDLLTRWLPAERAKRKVQRAHALG